MFGTLRDLWRQVSESFRVGFWWATSRVACYSGFHRIADFAGNLEQLKVAYATSGREARAELLQQLDSIVDQLAMPNGVTKTTHADRLGRILSAVLSAVHLPHSEIRVLDLPASTGIASLECLALLNEKFRVTSYLLGDLYHRVLYDPRRCCIFDEQGNLLQVAFKRLFFSLYWAYEFSNRYTFSTACLTFPRNVIAWYLRKRYHFEPGNAYRELLIVHPKVERVLGCGVCRLEKMDVFEPIAGRYDLILSFNLLQRSYFPADAIETGTKNLAASLSEGGLLIIGNEWESFRAFQKQDGLLVSRFERLGRIEPRRLHERIRRAGARGRPAEAKR
jgi:hypothetical protein